ncbi:MAG: hypothetical protein K2N11_05175, partial [Mucispirillum sp.]|nr:hypothetical protein [Mucispirillum sp.]
MKKYAISLMLTLLALSGCDALGIKQADNSSSDNLSQNTDAASSVSLDNKISASTGQQAAADEILNLQKEIDELVSTVNAKDAALAELENKLKLFEDEKQQIAAKAASVEAELADLKDTISTNNQYRNIAIIVALVSLFLNALLAYLLIITRIRNKRAALPPAKEDILAAGNNTKETAENSVQKTETNNQADNSTLSEDKNIKDIAESES